MRCYDVYCVTWLQGSGRGQMHIMTVATNSKTQYIIINCKRSEQSLVKLRY